MAQLTARTIIANLTKGRVATVTAALSKRGYATEASPEDYGYCKFVCELAAEKTTFLDPDPIEHAAGREKKMLIARLAGDDVSIVVDESHHAPELF